MAAAAEVRSSWDPTGQIRRVRTVCGLGKFREYMDLFHRCFIFARFFIYLFYSRSNSFVLIGCGFQRRKLLSLEACESTVFQLLGGDGFSEICLSFARGDIALRHRLTHLSVVSQHVCSSRLSPPPLQRAAPLRRGCRYGLPRLVGDVEFSPTEQHVVCGKQS